MTGHLLIADCRMTGTGSDVRDLVAKLHRRGFWTTLLGPDVPLPRGAAGLAVFLDDSADRSQALTKIAGRAQSESIPVIALFEAAEPSKVSDSLPPNVIVLHRRDASRDRALSRFANAIAGAVSERAGTSEAEHQAQAAQEHLDFGPAGRAAAVWSWPGALLGPLWPVAVGRPLTGLLGLALLIAGTVVAASLARSPLAPLVGFAGAWLAFAVLMGLFGGERAPGEADERWFRPVGALALGVVVGFVALVGWSKAQSERATLQPQLAGATGNTVLIGRQAINWSWDASWMDGLGELRFDLGGQTRPGFGDEIPPIDTGTTSSVVMPSAPPSPDDRETCKNLTELNAGKQVEDIATTIFCGDQDGTPPA